MNSAPGGQYSLENSAWGTVFTSENCLGGHFLGGAKFPMTPVPMKRTGMNLENFREKKKKKLHRAGLEPKHSSIQAEY